MAQHLLPHELTPNEREWVRARLTAQLGTAPSDPASPDVERVADAVDDLLDTLLRRRLADEARPADRGTPGPRDARHRVVITGLGIISAMGQSIDAYWDNLVQGRSGISVIEAYDVTAFRCKIAGEIKQWDSSPWIIEREAKRMSRASQFVVAAARQALDDSRFPLPPDGTDQLGVLIGSGTTAFPETEAEMRVLASRGPGTVSPFFVPMVLPNMPAGQLGLQFGARGWNAAITSACSASTTAIGEGAEIIRRGDVVAMLVGGTEAPIAEISMAGFNSLRALSTRNDDPAGACRPWDRTRDGMVGAEGAGMLLLERLDHALARGAPIYAEVLGVGGSCDAYHLVAPDPSGRGGALALNRALVNSGVAPTAVDYINAHGAGTSYNDPMETRVIKTVLGDHAYQVPISSTKSMAGHPLAACGAFEGIATVLTLKHGIIPPTINLHHADPDCDLDYTPLEARRADVRVAVSENFGLGGQNAAVVLRRWDGE
ncbi:MAG TPA: beta-ketoacyl-ACP synthase II [Chloroflexia bacterium]|nr:beta-ketoacyl-ACP synthase II [Chloroflexia bacterium]